jgi:DNA-binding transcriptional MerR regulator/methylmalonyl-CoA mutase cobalamin-binding subunit
MGRYPIRVAAQRSGITPDTLRAWERRYEAVTPTRTDADRRLYSDADIRRLRLLRELVAQGHGISGIAALPESELAGLLEGAPAASAAETASPELARARAALEALDATTLRQTVTRAMVELGPERVIEQLIAPLCRSIGHAWEDGTISVAHEHVASVALRNALSGMLDMLYVGGTGPTLVVATPAGERHEFGAMMAAAIALSAGWRTTYLGPDLPAADVAVAMQQLGADTVLLSVVRGHDPVVLEQELRVLRERVGPRVRIVAGGAGAAAIASSLQAAGVHVVHDLAALRRFLEQPAEATAGAGA